MKIPVPYGFCVSVEIDRDDSDNDNAKVIVHSPCYLNKKWFMEHCYKSSEFTDAEIIMDSDFKTVMLKHFG